MIMRDRCGAALPARVGRMTPAGRRRVRGISLVEAMVALAVMGFGTLAVLGVQASLRLNADVARQRSEAVRVAQEEMESLRAYADFAAFDALGGAGDEQAVDLATNSALTLARWVTLVATADEALLEDKARRKNVRIEVRWQDRTGTGQTVTLASTIQRTDPTLAASVAVSAARSPLRQPGGRHPAIPPEATIAPPDAKIDPGTSSFHPPGAAPDARWIFDNVTGLITKRCDGDLCTAYQAQLLAGYVRFATALGDDARPMPKHAATPPGDARLVDVFVETTVPEVRRLDAACYERLDPTGAVAYFCAVPVGASNRWSGTSGLIGGEGFVIAEKPDDTAALHFRVCRYTPVAGCDPAVGSKIWGFPGETASCSEPSPQTVPPTPSRLMRNTDHPRTYADVDGPLTNQNFLVIPAGNDAEKFVCPADAAGDFIDSNTWLHQPAA